MTMGEEIRRLRDLAGLSSRDLARATGLLIDHIMEIESDQVQPSPYATGKIVEAFRFKGVAANELAELTELGEKSKPIDFDCHIAAFDRHALALYVRLLEPAILRLEGDTLLLLPVEKIEDSSPELAKLSIAQVRDVLRSPITLGEKLRSLFRRSLKKLIFLSVAGAILGVYLANQQFGGVRGVPGVNVGASIGLNILAGFGVALALAFLVFLFGLLENLFVLNKAFTKFLFVTATGEKLALAVEDGRASRLAELLESRDLSVHVAAPT